MLHKELEIPAGISPTRSKLGIIEADGTWNRRVSPDFFAKPKQPEPTSFGSYLKNNASRQLR